MKDVFYPDYGSKMVEIFGRLDSYNFYAIQIKEIKHIDNDLYTIDQYFEFDNNTYLATFDFSSKELKSLFDLMPNFHRKGELLDRMLVLPIVPIIYIFNFAIIFSVNIEGVLGGSTESLYETFTPLKVKRFY